MRGMYPAYTCFLILVLRRYKLYYENRTNSKP
nr:MAG TPA: hypothetical protein [Caudoviricetes sp.]